MARKDNLVKSKSIYTLRKRHTTTTAGTIYENDYTTIVSNDDIYNDNMVLFSDSNFKFRVGRGNGNKRRHTRESWVKTDDDKNAWTRQSLSGYVKSDETQIVLKPNYSSIKDFAYYGSAVELVKATVNDIILRFPGGLSFYAKNDAPKVTVGTDEFYLVSNEFEINCWTTGEIFSGSVSNPMRVLAASYMYYVDKYGNAIPAPSYSANGSTCLNTIVGEATINGTKFPVYMDANRKKHLLTSATTASAEVIIRPKQSIIDQFWSSLDDFEKVLLNRSTYPVYKATFDTPYQTEDGFFYSAKDYVWPNIENSESGFTPDITTSKYQGYLESLIELAQFHDEYDSDNVWRMMTHESIKNLDWTFIRSTDDETTEVAMDSSKVQAMLHIFGREFDDLKRYAENIKASSNISYDEKNNVPDYFLSDVIENDGWEAKSVAPADDSASTTSDILYASAMTKGYKPSEANINFLRRLALNSDYIQSLKGTRAGLEAILHMFGYKSGSTSATTTKPGTYEINEYVRVAQNSLPYRYTSYLRGTCEYLNYDENTNYMNGYPVIVLDPSDDNNDAQFFLMPWMDKDVSYKYPIYFQQKGGWGRWNNKEINLPDITSATTIAAASGFCLYEETEPYLKYVDDINELLALPNIDLDDGTLCYVNDISDMDSYTAKTGEELKSGDTYSHYFVLENLILSTHLGYMDSGPHQGCYGWRNVYSSEFNGNTPKTLNGLRVLYMESLKADYNGNNPHTGKGKYDNGESYVKKYTELFGDAIADGVYNQLRDSSAGTEEHQDWCDIQKIGFSISPLKQKNNKCQYFFESGYSKTWAVLSGSNFTEHEKNYSGYYNPLSALTSGDTSEETASYSVMNVKNLEIVFKTGGNVYLEKYFRNVVLKYLEPMIPSTSILRYRFENDPVFTVISPVNSFTTTANPFKIIGHLVVNDKERIYYMDDTALKNNTHN